MEPDHAASEAAATLAQPNHKRLIVAAGAAALLLFTVAAVALWGPWQPSAPAKKARRVASAASAAAPAQPASAAASVAATSASAAAPLPQAASAATAAAPMPALAAADSGAAAARAAPPAAEEAPIDRLQRRLGEVLGASVTLDAARPGELRVLKRSGAAGPGAPPPRAASQGVAGPSQDDLTSSGGGLGAARPWGRSQASLAGRAWTYSGMTGPRAWARLDPAYSACATGRQQSPIDIRGGLAGQLEPLRFDYRAGRFDVVDTGHTVQVNAPPGNAIELAGTRYELQQLHFHRPSEERIDGRQFEMDVHLLHRDAAGRLAVVAVLLRRGAAQPLLHTVWQQLSSAAGDEAAPQALIDPRQLLPQDLGYYRYTGSLTTPPCTEGVLWLVLQQPLTVSAPQIDAFAQRYGSNARPLQAAAGREIRQSN